jgi:hypothetical protein
VCEIGRAGPKWTCPEEEVDEQRGFIYFGQKLKPIRSAWDSMKIRTALLISKLGFC